MFDMRFRLPELMRERGINTAYGLAKASRGAMSVTTASRIVNAGARIKRIDMTTLDILCDVLHVEPGELFERDKPRRR